MPRKPQIAVVDGQGGGVGKVLVERLRQTFGQAVKITALGTNSRATAEMLRAGADEGATGENAIVVGAGRADVITGVLAIVLANTLLGEVTPRMAEAIATSPAHKLLIPFSKCGVEIIGVAPDSLSGRIDQAVRQIGDYLAEAEA